MCAFQNEGTYVKVWVNQLFLQTYSTYQLLCQLNLLLVLLLTLACQSVLLPILTQHVIIFVSTIKTITEYT